MDKDMALIDCAEKAVKESFGTGRPKQEEVETVDNTPKTLAQYIKELVAYMESIPGPNEGRIQELRDIIRKGKLITKDAIRETAQKLTRQFLD